MSADFTPKKEDITILTPFKMQVLTNFPYIEADFDALTNYQLLCKIVEYLNKVIKETNNVSLQTLSLYNAFVALQHYVNTYFDNLDIQSEVDKKLDEMAEDGRLADMIAEYIKMQGQLVYNSVADMKAAENIQNGSFLKTYGFYEYNDGGAALYKARPVTNEDVIDEKLIIALNDETLVAELIISGENGLNVKQLGAYGDGVHNDTVSFQTGLDKCNSIFVPIGDYIIENLIMKTDYNIIGEHKYKSRILQIRTSLDNAIIRTDYENNITLHNIMLKDLSIISFGERTTYPIQLLNCDSVVVENCRIEQNNTTFTSIYHGLLVDKNAGFDGFNFVCRISNSRFVRSKIKINATDSYITKNEIWGENLDCALHIVNASSTTIAENQLVGGNVYGAIYIESPNAGLRIVNNYFDGSYNELDTKYGIYGNGLLKHAIIANNIFQKTKSGGIYLKILQESVINGNTFQDTDYYNVGSNDILIDDVEPSFGNIISNNAFHRATYYDRTTETVETRPTSNLTPVVNIKSTAGYQPSIIQSNTCSYPFYYGQGVFSGNIISRNNTTTLFYYAYNYNYGSTKNDKDIIYEDNSNPVTNRACTVINNGLTRIDNVKSLLVTNVPNFDCDGSYTEDYRIYVNNPNSAANLPSFVNNNCYIEYEHIASGYAKQTYTGVDINNVTYSKTRLLMGNTWTDFN